MPDAPAISPEEARAIAKDAYIYDFPLVDSHRIQPSIRVTKISLFEITRARWLDCSA